MGDYVGFCPKCSSVDKAVRRWVSERISRTALGHREAKCDHAWHNQEAVDTGASQSFGSDSATTNRRETDG